MKVASRLGASVPAYLVVDDSPTVRLTLASTLKTIHEGLAVQVTQAETAREAVDAFLQGSFDAVFLDMMLGTDKTALDVLRAIFAAKPEAKTILMTGLAREDPHVVEAISLGAFAYLRKPVRAADVRGVLDEIAIESGRSGRIR